MCVYNIFKNQQKELRGMTKKKSEEIKEMVQNWLLNNPGGSVLQCSKDLGITWVTANSHVSKIKNSSYADIIKCFPPDHVFRNGKINPSTLRKVVFDLKTVANLINVPEKLIIPKINQIIKDGYGFDLLKLFGVQGEITTQNVFKCFAEQTIFNENESMVKVYDIVYEFDKWCKAFGFVLETKQDALSEVHEMFKNKIVQHDGAFFVLGIKFIGINLDF